MLDQSKSNASQEFETNPVGSASMKGSQAEGDNNSAETSQPGYPEFWENLRADLKKPRTYVEILAVLGLFTFLALAAWQSCETGHLVTILQREFDVSQRPYVGVNHISRSFSKSLPDGQEIAVDGPDSGTHALNFTIEIKNFGPAPGVNYYTDWSVFVGGVNKKPPHPAPRSHFSRVKVLIYLHRLVLTIMRA